MRKPLRFQRKRKRVSFLRRRFFWYGTAGLFAAFFLFYTAVLSPWLEIREVRVEGASEIIPERVAASVESGFWQSFFGMPQNSILLAKTAELEKSLQEAFPAIDGVSVKRSFPHALVVDIREREQAGTWCKEELCFALDRKGVAFKEAQESEEYAVFSSSSSGQLGQEVLAPDVLAKLLGFQESFLQAGELARFSVVSFEVGDTGQVEVTTNGRWKILLDTKESMEWQETKLEAVLREKVPLEKRGGLDYIDLRFGDQAYIKYQE